MPATKLELHLPHGMLGSVMGIACPQPGTPERAMMLRAMGVPNGRTPDWLKRSDDFHAECTSAVRRQYELAACPGFFGARAPRGQRPSNEPDDFERRIRRDIDRLRARVRAVSPTRPVPQKPPRQTHSDPEMQRVYDAMHDVMPYCDEDTALHESAHPTMLCHFGCEVLDVFVNGDDSGRTQYRAAPKSFSQHMQVLVAGYCATGDYHTRGAYQPGVSRDREQIADLVREKYPNATDEDAQILAMEYEPLARHVLSARWPFVRALANRLQKYGRVTGREVHELWDSFDFQPLY